jgi:selenocysteine-specific translation elongation factor
VERRRRITIDLGLAPLQLSDIHRGIVDVPGHVRFIRNTLSGATGMDHVLFVLDRSEVTVRDGDVRRPGPGNQIDDTTRCRLA